MTLTEIVEYQLLAADEQAASISLLSGGLRNSTLLQLVRLSTGKGQAFSVYAIYREGPMTFEASAKLQVIRPGRSLESILRDVVTDADFLQTVLAPMKVQVDKHFAAQR